MHTFLSFMLVFLLGVTSASAGPRPAAETTQEIDRLFAVLRGSGCEFQRNGRWHSAEQAATHLQRKREYIAGKGLLTDTESLIELAASKSSLSGRPYRVKCPGSAVIESRAWFMQALAQLRRSGGR